PIAARWSTYHGASSPSPKRKANESGTSAGPAKPSANTSQRAGGAPLRTCGSQSHTWTAGRTNRSANGFVARTSNATTARASRAAVSPASNSSPVTGRRGTSRCLSTSQPQATTAASSASAKAGQSPDDGSAGFGGRAGPPPQAPARS